MADQVVNEPAVPPGMSPWFAKFQQLLVRRQLEKALSLLNEIIEGDLPLLDFDAEIAEDRRVAWLCRIDLLREAGRLTEALAWACLECELHPDNVAAQAVKEELKRLTRFGQRPPGTGPAPSRTRIIRWQGLAGMRTLRAELERDVIIPLLNPEQYRRYKVPLPNGILLHGPPGCGKTHIATTLAKMIGFSVFTIGPSDLASIYVHGTQKMIGALFKKAEAQAPAIIFFDEFDAFVPSRDRGTDHHYEAEVNEFLTQLNECALRRILVVAATNRPDKIDVAVLRPGRIDKQFFVGLPDFEALVELFRLYLAGRPAAGIDYLALARFAEGYTPAEVRELVNQAARWALEADVSIGQAHVLRAMQERPPSLKREDMVSRRIGFGVSERTE